MIRTYSKSLHSFNPIPGGCVLYLPLPNPGLHGTTFSSVDPFHHDLTRLGGVMDGDGFTTDGDDFIATAAKTWGVANAWSIYIWLNPDDTTTHMRALTINNAAAVSRVLIILNQNAGTELRVLAYGTGGNKDYRKNIITATKQLLTLTWDGTNLLIYRNAALQTMTKTTDDAITMADDSRDFVLGKQSITFYSGSIPEVWYYDNPHAQGLVTYMYDQTKGRDA